LNIINDPQIEDARTAFKKAISGLDVKDLRKDMPTRQDIKKEVDSILSKFDF
jgi:hypothetical protein